ncbi:MAG: hypothetical protein ABI459_04910 [Deltaproteobacteria bacterium]
MPIIIAIITALGGAYFWFNRMKNARDASETLFEAANDVRLAARRFGFRRKVNIHPAGSIDDPRLAVASIVAALMQIDRAWEREMSDGLSLQLQSIYVVKREEAEEMVTFARWMSEQCGTKHEAVRRVAKRLATLKGKEVVVNIRQMADRLVAKPDGSYSDPAQDAIEALRRQFR